MPAARLRTRLRILADEDLARAANWSNEQLKSPRGRSAFRLNGHPAVDPLQKIREATWWPMLRLSPAALIYLENNET